ncbi:predicted protein [Thalassiosira pseudonana CCMP1335]|uniref:Uncharacterized protein n=2 Tax=Thalassiosira pseudonana TaxID=35128 RepID=B8BT82_THAPS|nr:predicted protein [Thalassiosira pseudonana CCMP1335]EED94555.1 predicted protein [Thalassiosira pseudonana CCMP1335]
MSRYGIFTAPSQISQTISKGFGGGGISEADGDTMDLTEVMAMLLIPTLLKGAVELGVVGSVGEKEEVGEKDEVGEKEEVGEKKLDDTNGTSSLLVDEFAENKDSMECSGTAQSTSPDVKDAKTMSKSVRFSKIVTDNTGLRQSLVGESTPSSPQDDTIPHNQLFQYVLRMILFDVTGDYEPKPINVDLLKRIFLFYGERDVADNEDLLERMVALANQVKGGGDGGESGGLLDEHTFAHCLTSDVKLYNAVLRRDSQLTSTYDDVFNNGELNELDEREESVANEVTKIYTMPSIDYAVDTFRSKTYVILLWFTFVLFYMSYIGLFGSRNPELGNLSCEQYSIQGAGFPCSIGQGVISWLIIMVKLVLLGSVFIIGSSIGHSTSPHSPFIVLISMGFVCLYTFVPLNVEWQLLPSSDGKSDEMSTKIDDDSGERFRHGILFLTTRPLHRLRTDYTDFLLTGLFSTGVMLLLLSFQSFLDRLIPVSFLNKHKLLQQILASGTVFMERNMKLAATFKIDRMIRNAHAVHRAAELEHDSSGKETSYGKALLSYSKTSDDTEEVGGYRWTWNQLRTAQLFEEEGIWLSNRVMQGNLGQMFLCLLLVPFLIIITDTVYSLYETFGIVLPDNEQWRVIVPLSMSFILAEINSLLLVAVYIPSTIRTTFQFRFGTIGSLHNNDFLKLRTQTDQASFIFGSMFWGCLVSNVLVLGVSFVVVFIFCFEPFLPVLLSIVASVIGLAITITIKMLFLIGVRKVFSGETFYRSNPAIANCINVLLESWNLGISVLFVVIRMITLVSVAFIYVARVDVPFLSVHADEIGPVVLDKAPYVFRKDILQHEAHRHPYLERIGSIYMMKLRYGDRFGREAGTAWRLLFVFALMPWLRRYRIRAEENNVASDTHIEDRTDKGMDATAVTLQIENESLKKEIEALRSELLSRSTSTEVSF